MRIYAEAYLRHAQLVKVDREESIDNLERSFEALLENFHALYDVSKNELKYFDHADTSLLIALRNAIHHREHPLFISLRTSLWLDGQPQQWLGAQFLLSRHRMVRGASPPFTHYILLDDIDARLNPARGSAHIDRGTNASNVQARFNLLESGLALGTIRDKALAGRYPSQQVYLDILPIFNSAISRVFSALKSKGVRFVGFDAKAYADTFINELQVDLQVIDFWVYAVTPIELCLGALSLETHVSKLNSGTKN